jgi:cysteine sulfinate desulfinase/cysteine desulfurase-like protein
MLAMGVSHQEANALVRFSLGRESTFEEVDAVGQILPKVIARAQLFQ